MPAQIRSLITLLVAGTLACGTAISQDTQTANEPEAGTAPAASGGLRAYLDPATGRLIDHPPYGRPTIELRTRELYMFTTDDFGLIERKMPDGSYAMDLEGRFRQGTVATVGENGEIETHRIGGEIFASPAGERIRDALRRDMRKDGDGENAQ